MPQLKEVYRDDFRVKTIDVGVPDQGAVIYSGSKKTLAKAGVTEWGNFGDYSEDFFVFKEGMEISLKVTPRANGAGFGDFVAGLLIGEVLFDVGIIKFLAFSQNYTENTVHAYAGQSTGLTIENAASYQYIESDKEYDARMVVGNDGKLSLYFSGFKVGNTVESVIGMTFWMARAIYATGSSVTIDSAVIKEPAGN